MSKIKLGLYYDFEPDKMPKSHFVVSGKIDARIFYTIGYGILQGTRRKRKLAFQKRLRDLQKSIGNLWVVDIRAEGCGSRNGPAFNQGGMIHYLGMCSTVRESGSPGAWLNYLPEPELANTFGSTKKGMENYSNWLSREISKHGDVSDAFYRILRWIDEGLNYKIVLLCGCKDPYKMKNHRLEGRVPTGDPNCHRVPLGIELAGYFENCQAVHL